MEEVANLNSYGASLLRKGDEIKAFEVFAAALRTICRNTETSSLFQPPFSSILHALVQSGSSTHHLYCSAARGFSRDCDKQPLGRYDAFISFYKGQPEIYRQAIIISPKLSLSSSSSSSNAPVFTSVVLLNMAISLHIGGQKDENKQLMALPLYEMALRLALMTTNSSLLTLAALNNMAQIYSEFNEFSKLNQVLKQFRTTLSSASKQNCEQPFVTERKVLEEFFLNMFLMKCPRCARAA